MSYPTTNLEFARDLFRGSVEILSREARNQGVRLLIENNVLARFNAADGINRLVLLCSLEDLAAFDREFPQDNVGLLLDMGHLKVSAQTLAFDPNEAIRCASPRVEALHLHDNDGMIDSHRLFDDSAWFMPCLTGLAAHAVMIIEVARSPWQDLLAAALATGEAARIPAPIGGIA